jgi:DsbC/DsbD-like thiol-disulfide interchange protein
VITRYRRLVTVMLQLFALLLAMPALAQGKPTNIRPQLLVEGPAAPGGTVTLAFLMTPQPSWHGYWQNPGDAGLGMTTEWTLPKGASAGALQYPVPGTLLISGLMNHVYKTEYAVLLPLTLPADARPGTRLPIRVKLGWLACTDEVCVPEEAELSAEITVGQPGSPDARFDQWRMALPAPLGSTARFAIAAAAFRAGRWPAAQRHALRLPDPQPQGAEPCPRRRKRRARPAPKGWPIPPGWCWPAWRWARCCWPCAPRAAGGLGLPAAGAAGGGRAAAAGRGDHRQLLGLYEFAVPGFASEGAAGRLRHRAARRLCRHALHRAVHGRGDGRGAAAAGAFRRWRCSPRSGWALPCRSSPSPSCRACAAPCCRGRARGW